MYDVHDLMYDIIHFISYNITVITCVWAWFLHGKWFRGRYDARAT
jgi:hypothetical protein